MGFEYSRYNYNATLLYQDNLFRASDHNPELTGLNLPFTTESSLTDSTVTPTSVTLENGSVTITSTVTGTSVTPTGTVEYWLGTTKLGESVLDGAGATSFTYGPFTSLGTKTIEIRYLGDTIHNGSTDTVTVEVTKGVATVDATADATEIEVRTGTVTVDATVTSTGPAPTGTVQYLVDGVRIASSALRADGTTSAVLGPFAAAGDVSIEVRYLGDARTLGASDTVDVTVTKAATTTTLSLSKGSVPVNSGTTTATAVVSSAYGTAGGSVDFLVDGDVVATGTLSAGKVSVPLGPFDTLGSKTVEARYAGNAALDRELGHRGAERRQGDADDDRDHQAGHGRGQADQGQGHGRADRAGAGGDRHHPGDGRGLDLRRQPHRGKATVTLKAFKATGRQKVTVVYAGDDLNKSVTKTVTIKVTR